MERKWYLYILRCGDNTLYTGITTDVEKRLDAHLSGKGAKYTRGRAPLQLVYREECESHSHALKREAEIKKLTRLEKEKTHRISGNIRESGKIVKIFLDKTVSLCYLECVISES